MCCNNRVERDLMKNFESSNAEDSRKGSQPSSCSESDHATYHLDAVRSLDLFSERHLLKRQHLIRKSAKSDSRRTRKASLYCRSVPFYPGARPPTFLEQQLFPKIKTDDADRLFASDKSEGAQLTIFYKGSINVYDNVSADKANAIMLLAGESSLKVPAMKNEAEQGASIPIREPDPTSVCKLQANLPITSRRSLRAFFDKRRDRVMNNSPYATPTHIKQEDG